MIATAHRCLISVLFVWSPCALAAGQDEPQAEAPPARALSLELTSRARLAGTSGSLRAAEMVARVLAEAGLAVEIDQREVMLSLPRRLELALFESDAAAAPFHERIERFDPDAAPPGDIPPFNAWTASGDVSGPVVDAGYGTRADFERLRAARCQLEGSIALCRYGKGYRGIKVDLATEFGCAGVLLFSDPADDGVDKGLTWPAGPWKPDWAMQRGSISPMGRTPGDPTTPGFPSPAPGALPQRERLAGDALAAALPTIPCMPIGASEAALLRERLTARRVAMPEGPKKTLRVGPGPVIAQLVIDAPRTQRTIRNVIGRLAGERAGLVLVGNHRDAWVRGAHDAGGGTVALLRAAQRLGARASTGWKPARSIAFAFWDAEEFGLIGSTEWAEDNADELQRDLVCYINADAAVSGTRFRASGTPGLEAVLARSLAQVPWPSPPADEALFGKTLLDQWMETSDRKPRLDLPGAGSDFTVFLHHLMLPVIDFGFGGNSGGQYHTRYDDFLMMERYLDPGFVGHETAGHFVAVLLEELANNGRMSMNDAFAAAELERLARDSAEWLGEERANQLAISFQTLSRAITLSWLEWQKAFEFQSRSELGPLGDWPGFLDGLASGANASATRELHADASLPPQLYAELGDDQGLPGRPWFRHQLWTASLESGYGAETFPRLRAALADERALRRELDAMIEKVDALRVVWDQRRENLRAGK